MVVVIWKCKECGSIQVSNSKKRHEMDFCECGSVGYDLEEGYARISYKSPQDFEIIKKIKHEDMDVWRELHLGAIEQGFANKVKLGKHTYYESIVPSIVELIEEIEKEVYLGLVE